MIPDGGFIGSGVDVDLRIPHGAVMPRHLEVMSIADDLVEIIDRTAAPGVDAERLRPDDVFRIGPWRLDFQPVVEAEIVGSAGEAGAWSRGRAFPSTGDTGTDLRVGDRVGDPIVERVGNRVGEPSCSDEPPAVRRLPGTGPPRLSSPRSRLVGISPARPPHDGLTWLGPPELWALLLAAAALLLLVAFALELIA